MARSRRKYTRELLQDAVGHATSVAGVLRYLGLHEAGGTHAHISRTIKAFGIDTSRGGQLTLFGTVATPDDPQI